ncbi:unnamed protein product [Toxocara canis]|uniref:Uncharacterized protein n=1 Tax=Toxocara canis TaxID=6265 RepID=A0A183TYV0_TOXCA|nr:unnamed protein product [Toxocara canis]
MTQERNVAVLQKSLAQPNMSLSFFFGIEFGEHSTALNPRFVISNPQRGPSSLPEGPLKNIKEMFVADVKASFDVSVCVGI